MMGVRFPPPALNLKALKIRGFSHGENASYRDYSLDRGAFACEHAFVVARRSIVAIHVVAQFADRPFGQTVANLPRGDNSWLCLHP
jgi:hypothetical protein